jgi:tRNA nucleotidyltransferase (CCA-adding enzyme)
MRSRPPRDPSRALVRLRRRAVVRALSAVARRLGIEAWLVGGAVRDACLGLAVPEIDVAVTRDAEGAARALEAQGAGRAVFLSRGRPGPRVYRVAGRCPLDIAEIEGGSIEADLARRDFTVNAVAVALPSGALLDPFGGMKDLARRRLVPVRAKNLVEDPLRALRAARLFATHGLEPDRATLAAARQAAPRLSGVAGERVGAELSRLLGSPRCAPALAWAARARILPAAFCLPLSSGGGAAALARSLRGLDDAATRRLPAARRRRLRLAALALRFGLSGRDARKWLAGRRFPRREADEAARLVDLARAEAAIRVRRDAWRWVLEAGPLAPDALHLIARLGKPRRRRAESLRRLARRQRRRVAVTGSDVMRWLGIPSGPMVGALLSELAVAAACGDVKNRREARHWLSVQVRDSRAPAIISEH